MAVATAVYLLSIMTTAIAMTTSWPSSGGDLQNRRFSDLKCLDKNKLNGGITVKWQYKTGATVAATPTTCGGFIYVVDWKANIYKFSEDGKVQWQTSIKNLVQGAGVRTSPVFDAGCTTLYVFTQWSPTCRIVALNAATGKLAYNKVVDEHPLARATGSPTFYGGAIYFGSSSATESSGTKPSWRGSMFKVDAKTGSIVWRTYLTPAGYTGVPIWSSNPTIDTARGQVCVGTGNNYDVPASVAQCVKSKGSDFTAQRTCNDPRNYVDAVVCMALGDGKVKWARGYHGIDIYMAGSGGLDWDFGQNPILVGNKMLAISKSGQPLALDAATGSNIWGPKDIPGGTKGYSLFGSCSNNNVFVVGLFWYSSKKGIVAAYDVNTGAQKWVWENMDGGVYGPLTCTNSVVFAPLFDPKGSLVALDIGSGKRLGSFSTGKTLFCGPSIVKGVAYVGNGYSANGGVPGDTLYALQLPLLGTC